MLAFIKKSILSIYMQYELVTCIYMFEPWEKNLINGFVGVILALVLFSSYVYLPSYIETFLQFVTPLSLQQEKSSSTYATPILQTDAISIS